MKVHSKWYTPEILHGELRLGEEGYEGVKLMKQKSVFIACILFLTFGLATSAMSQWQIMGHPFTEQPHPPGGGVNAPENLTCITVMNILGKKVVEIANPHSSDCTLDFSKLSPGLYYVIFLMGSSVLVKKIIKE